MAALSLWPKQNFGDPVTTTTKISSSPVPIASPMTSSPPRAIGKSPPKTGSRGRYSRAAHDQTTIGSLLPGFELNIPPRNIVALASWTRIFTPASWSANFAAPSPGPNSSSAAPIATRQGYYEQFGINHPLAGAQFEGAPTLTFSNVTLTTFGDDDFNYQRDISNEFNYAGNLSWMHGNQP